MARQNHIFKKIRAGSQAEKLMEKLVDRPASGGLVSIDTIGKIRDAGMALELSCGSCGEKDRVRGEELVSRYGADTPIRDVRPACSSCGSAAVSVVPQSA